jgi:hypothetical protein
MNQLNPEDLLRRIRQLEGKLAISPISRAEVVLLVEEGLKVLAIENREIVRALEQPNFRIRRRTGVSLTEAAMAVQKGISLLARIDDQVKKPFSSLLDSRMTPDAIMALIDATDKFDEEIKFLTDAAEMTTASVEEWVHVAWGKLWIQVLVSWTNGYRQSGTKPWLVFVEEVYNIGDETPRSRTWLRRKFDEIYERCIQQPELTTLLVGANGWLPPKPKQGRKTINAYLQSERKNVKQWACTGSTPTGNCLFRISPEEALGDGLNFPKWACEHDRRRCPESLYCGGLCVPQFETLK